MKTYKKVSVELDKEKKAEQLREKFVMWAEREERINRDDWMSVVKEVAILMGIGLAVFMVLFSFDSPVPFQIVILGMFVVLLIATGYVTWEEYKSYYHDRTFLETVKCEKDPDTIMEIVQERENTHMWLVSSFVKENELAAALIRGEMPIEICIPQKKWDHVGVICQNNNCEVLRYEFHGKMVHKVNQEGAVLNMDEDILYLPWLDMQNFLLDSEESDRW